MQTDFLVLENLKRWVGDRQKIYKWWEVSQWATFQLHSAVASATAFLLPSWKQNGILAAISQMLFGGACYMILKRSFPQNSLCTNFCCWCFTYSCCSSNTCETENQGSFIPFVWSSAELFDKHILHKQQQRLPLSQCVFPYTFFSECAPAFVWGHRRQLTLSECLLCFLSWVPSFSHSSLPFYFLSISLLSLMLPCSR